MIKKFLIAMVMATGLAQTLSADMSAGMPDMQMDMAAVQKGMKMLPFLNAPIESTEKLTAKDVELFIEAVQKKDQNYVKYSDQMEKGYEKAAEVLKPGVSFDTFVKKAIELSGVKSEMDSEAKSIGYDSALDLTLKSTKIMRAMMHIEMEKEIAKAPKEQQEMMRSMTSGMMGTADSNDIAVVKPYADKIKEVMKNMENSTP